MIKVARIFISIVPLDIKGNPDPATASTDSYNPYSGGLNGTQIFETDDIMLLYNWMTLWTDVLIFECDAVVEDEDAGAICVEMMRRINS